MPFAQKTFIPEPEKEKQRARRAQNNVYNTFNSKRNAGRITRYFIILRSSRLQRSIYIIEFVFVIIVIAIFLILMRNSFTSEADTLKRNIMRNTFYQVESSVQYLLQIPTFYSSFIGTFLLKSNVPYPRKNSANFYASFLTHAHMTSPGNIDWWKIGLPSGGMFAIVTNETFDNIIWVYTEYLNQDRGRFFEWVTDENKRNESYPYTNGKETGVYNTTSRYWYEIATATNHTTWTNVYYEILPENSDITSDAIFSAVSSVWEGPNTLICAISLDMRLRYIQDSLRGIQMPEGSGIAITSSDGFLVAVTSGSGQVFDILDNGLIAASIQDLDDPIWQCISRTPQFRTTENFAVDCNIDNQEANFEVSQSLIVFSDTINWTLHTAIRADEVYQTGNTIYNSSFVISSVLCIILCFLIYGISQLVRSYMLSEQSKLLLSQKNSEKSHVVLTGIFQSFNLLKKINTAHTNNANLTHDALIVANIVKNSPKTLFFNYKQLMESIESPQVRSKIMEVYNIKPFLINCGISSSPLHFPENEQSEFNHESVYLDTTSDTVNFPNNNASLQNDIDEVSSHQYVQSLHYKAAINLIQALGVSYNIQNPLFEEEEYGDFIINFLASLPKEHKGLLVDSFDLYGQFIKYFGQSMLSDHDLILAGFITLLAFHKTMVNRFDQNISIVNHYFVLDKEKMLIDADDILIQFSNFLIKGDHNILQRWVNLVSYVHSLVSITPLDRHIEVFQRCHLFIISSFRFQKLMPDRSEELLNFFYIASTISYFLNTPEYTKSVHDKFINEEEHDFFIEQFLPCLKTVYLPKLIRIVIQICGKRFYQRLINPTSK